MLLIFTFQEKFYRRKSFSKIIYSNNIQYTNKEHEILGPHHSFFIKTGCFRKYVLTCLIPRKIDNVTLYSAEAAINSLRQIQWVIKGRSIVDMFIHISQIEREGVSLSVLPSPHHMNGSKLVDPIKFALVSEV